MARRGRPVPSEAFELRFEPRDPVHDATVRWGGGRVTVAGALPGERLRVRPRRWLRKGPRSLDCEVERVLEPHPERVAPRCPAFGRCGGCALQHLSGPAQLREKAAYVRRLLGEAGAPAPEAWAPPVPSPAYGYRHKARLGVRHVPAKGGALVGFRERGSAKVTDTDRCPILHPAIGTRLRALRDLIAQLSVAGAVPQIEVAVGEAEAVLVLRHLEPLAAQDEARLRAFARARDLTILLQPAGPDSVRPLLPDRDGALTYALPAEGLRYRFHALQFTQVNPAVNARMVARAVRWLAPGPGDRVLDLFCGLGNFTLPLARRAGAVLGLEGDPALVELGRRNAAENDVPGARFEVADLHRPGAVLPDGYTMALLDPPRSGAGACLEALLRAAPRRIVYVACGPEAFAREAARLCAAGYGFRRAGVLDMFPHTRQFETMGLFERLPGC